MIRLRWALCLLCLCFGGQSFAAGDMNAARAQFETSCLAALQLTGRADPAGLERMENTATLLLAAEEQFLFYSKGAERWSIMVPVQETAPVCGLGVAIADIQEAAALWAAGVQDWSLVLKQGFDPKPAEKDPQMFLGKAAGFLPEDAGFGVYVSMTFVGRPEDGQISMTAVKLDSTVSRCEFLPEECS